MDIQRLFPQLDVAVTRGHNYRVHGGRYRKDVQGRFFTQRVVGVWERGCKRVKEGERGCKRVYEGEGG